MKTKEERIREYEELMDSSVKLIHPNILDALGFFDAPASTKYHGAYEGGLFDHSLMVTKELVNLTEKLGLEWGYGMSPYVVGMYHDLCKCDQYIKTEDGWAYNPNIIIPGHGDKSVMIAQKLVPLTDEEIACIRWHMGAYEKDTSMWGYYGKAIEKYPNVLYTHTADMIASRIDKI